MRMISLAPRHPLGTRDTSQAAGPFTMRHAMSYMQTWAPGCDSLQLHSRVPTAH
ncbi:unnamed protein product, partial [Staurois parvus]